MARCLMMTGGRWGLGRQQSVIEILPESGAERGKHLNVVVWSGLLWDNRNLGSIL